MTDSVQDRLSAAARDADIAATEILHAAQLSPTREAWNAYDCARDAAQRLRSAMAWIETAREKSLS